SHQIIWFKNNGNSTFSDASVISENQAEGPLTVHADDLDNDGDMDVIASSNYDNTISWYRNNGSGSFSDEQVVTTNAGWGEDLYTGDLDGDGDADLIVAMRYGNEVVWYENLGLGFFSEKYLISNIIDGPFAVYCEDLDGDGDLDVISGASNDEIAWYENSGAQGCTDPEAENYNPIASLDNGSCCFGTSGCANPNAVNFNPEAQCDNGSCRFRFEGFVFHDENENGIWDEGMEGEEGEEDIAPEYLLPSQEIRIEPIGLITWTDDSGAFSFEATAGYFNIEVVNSESMPFSTTINPLAYNGSQAPSEIRFGVSQESPVFEVAVDFYSSRSGYPCNDWVNHDFCFRNNGNTPIDGVIELEINPLFQDFMLSEPLDSLVDGFLYLSFDNLLPGQTECRTMDLLTPTVDYIGEVIVSTARVYGYQDEVQIAFGEDVIEVEMTCSYDPNDKQVFPNGYAEPHYILNDTQLEYLIRFQNTGNAPASNVLISDTLDANLNLETFALVAHSHSVQVTLKQDLRVVEFLFENIMLPDSTSNEAESHGLVSFLINPHTELTPGTELNNTGNIFFDNNPPIITNTTWNTIYECTNELADVEPFENMLCPSELFVVENNQDYVETYHWSAEGENISTDSIMNSYFTPGEHSILLEVSNPICEASNTFNIDVLDHPEITITSDTSICSGDSVVIAIESDDNVQWQNLGIGLEHTVSPLETQEYIAVANNEEGCELEESVVITVNENPEMSISEGQVICAGDSVTITVNSEDNVHWQNLDEELEQIVSPTETQEYIAVANTEQGCESEGSVIIAVNPTPTAFAGDDTFICVGGTTMLTGEGGGEYAWTGFDEGPTITVAPVENTSYELLVTNEFNCQD
ncbi:MAG: DUF7619 domain-containing protein, partial [Flavobacteriales bacterium]